MRHHTLRWLCLLLGGLLCGRTCLADEAVAEREGRRQLGLLRAGTAFRAARGERLAAKPGLLYLQAAVAFERAGDVEEARNAVTAGVFTARALRATWPHPQGAVAMTFLDGGRQALTVGVDGDVHVWDAKTGRELRSFRVEEPASDEGRILGAAFSRNCSMMLVWGTKSVQLWDIPGGRRLHKWEDKASRAGAAFLLPVFRDEDRRVLLSGGSEAPPRLWDIENQRPAGRVNKGAIEEGGLTASPDRRRFLTGDGDGLYLWDASDAKLLRTFPAGEGKRRSSLKGVFTPDGKRLLGFPFPDGSARLYEADTGRLLVTLAAEDAAFKGVEFSADGKKLLAWHRGDGPAQLWDADSGQRLKTFEGSGQGGARFSPDGTHVLTFGDPARMWYVGGDNPGDRLSPAAAGMFTRQRESLILWGGTNRNAEVWDTYPRLLLSLESRTRGKSNEAPAADCLLSEDETLLLVREPRGKGAAVRLWDLRYLNEWRSYREKPVPRAVTFPHDHPVLTGALDRQEGRVLTCDAGGLAHLWDVKERRRLRSFEHGGSARGAAFHPDETRVLTWGEAGAKLWDANTGKPLRTFVHTAEVRGAAFGPGGKHLLTWDVDYVARWWDLTREEPLHRFEHRRDLFGASLDGKGARALTWGLDGEAKVWDLATGRLIRALAHDRPVGGAAFASEDRVWTWSAAGFHEWDLKTGKQVRSLRPRFPAYPRQDQFNEGVVSAELTRDGRRFVLADAGGWVRYWDIARERELPVPGSNPYTKRGYRGYPQWALNADQTRIANLGPEGSVLLNDLGTGLELQVFRHEGRVNGMAFSRDDSRLLTWSADKTARLWETESPLPWAAGDQLLELEFRSGFRIDELGRLKALTLAEWQARRERLDGTVRKKYGRPTAPGGE